MDPHGYICPRPTFSHTRLSVNSSDLFSFTFVRDPSLSLNSRFFFFFLWELISVFMTEFITCMSAACQFCEEDSITYFCTCNFVCDRLLVLWNQIYYIFIVIICTYMALHALNQVVLHIPSQIYQQMMDIVQV